MPKEKNKTIKGEICTIVPAVIIHEKIYYCADCYIFETKVPFSESIQNLYAEGQNKKLLN